MMRPFLLGVGAGSFTISLRIYTDNELRICKKALSSLLYGY